MNAQWWISEKDLPCWEKWKDLEWLEFQQNQSKGTFFRRKSSDWLVVSLKRTEKIFELCCCTVSLVLPALTSTCFQSRLECKPTPAWTSESSFRGWEGLEWSELKVPFDWFWNFKSKEGPGSFKHPKPSQKDFFAERVPFDWFGASKA